MTPTQPPTNLSDLKRILAEDDFLREIACPKSKCEVVLEKFLTNYAPLLETKKTILKLSNAELPVLILGETGTGKELIAEALHGDRKGKFVPVNCSGIPGELLESEFFGSIKGAFTGAIDKTGYVKEAENGTLFLDEIGDMPPLLQAKILRLLQGKRFRRVGSSSEECANFRLVSATNKMDIESSNGLFRIDLYYRISGTVIKLPSLKERGVGDIGIIVDKFARKELVGKIHEHLQGVNLKGNVRQLLNIIEEFNVLY